MSRAALAAGLLLLAGAIGCGGERPATRKPAAAATAPDPTPDIGDYSDGPPETDFRFLNDAPAELGHRAVLSATDEPGERMRIRGRLLTAAGQPAPGHLMYFYHTDARGVYAGGEQEPRWSYKRWHGRLDGFLRTGEQGEYEIESIRPGSYPDGSEPAHIHCAVRTPEGSSFWVMDFVFEGDPLLTEAYWSRTERWGFERYAGVRLERGADGVLEGTRDVRIRAE